MLVCLTAMLEGWTRSRADVARGATGVRMSRSVRVGNLITLRATAILVDLKGVDAPVGVGESGRVILDVGIAGASEGGAA